MLHDTGGLEVLDQATCMALLASAPVGRIVFTHAALPAIQPVNFLLHGGDIIVRTVQGSKLAAAARHAIVAFETDEFDPDTRTGWSVVVVGHAHQVTDADQLAVLRDLPLHTWAPGGRDAYLRITPEILTGRRI